VLSSAFAGMAAFTALGALAAGALIGPFGLVGLLNVQAALHVGAGLVVLLGLVRSRKTVEEPELDTAAPLPGDMSPMLGECQPCSPPATST
jgi:hypothetical protein